MPIEKNKSEVSHTDNNCSQRLIALLHRIEDAVLVFVLSAMVILATLQIFLRNFFDSGISWADPLLRSMVLWIALLGALIAARSDKHLSIDVLSRVLPERVKTGLKVVTNSFVTLICFLIAWYSAAMVWSDYQEGTIAFAPIPSWVVEIIIPFAFMIMALRYAAMVFLQLQKVLQNRQGS